MPQVFFLPLLRVDTCQWPVLIFCGPLGFLDFNSILYIRIYHLSLFAILFQTLPRIPKLFTPSVACSSCLYANDEIFNFCQQCGYKRKRAQDHEVMQQLKKVVVQESVISERVEQLARQHQSSRYVRQKSALEQELSNFLFSLSSPESIAKSFAVRRCCFPCMERSWRKNTRSSTGLPEACPLSVPLGSCSWNSRLSHGQIKINFCRKWERY